MALLTTATKPVPLRSDSGPLSSVDVILPAGGRIAGEFAREVGTEIKALIRFEGQTILAHTLATLRATGRIGRCIVIGPEAARAEAIRFGADIVLDEGSSGPENIFRGLKLLTDAEEKTRRRVVIATTDLPFLTADAILTFLNACPATADLALAVVTQADFEARFPDTGSVFVPLRNGSFTLGCLFLVEPYALLRNRLHVDRAFAARKSNLTMAQLLGPAFILRFLLRQLAIADIEKRCQKVLNCVGVAIPGMPAELALDIDTQEEYAYARAQMAKERRP